MPAADITRTVLQAIPVKEDLETRVSLVRWPQHPEYGEYVEVADYVPSRDIYGRGYVFPAVHAPKVATGMRAVKAAQA